MLSHSRRLIKVVGRSTSLAARKYVGEESTALRVIPGASGPVLTGGRFRTQQVRSYNFFSSGRGPATEAENQAYYLKDLGRRDPEAVIRAYESGQIPQTEATLAEYVKALVKADRLDHSRLIQHLQNNGSGGGGVEAAASFFRSRNASAARGAAQAEGGSSALVGGTLG
eukprot:CAMPEP_0198228154 /NCGR_PEP_ID=MMETSP1445-20131203/112099_1 /TAXON_ID=36898 /ORGANISM="Pyramimonas sp., Strain CCMP2087" /LENGTH=168 /DNA_ID=CAMNT_0043908425 /DNA_START=88 /DNA_END=590 /DNA_ORIENTATION=+